MTNPMSNTVPINIINTFLGVKHKVMHLIKLFGNLTHKGFSNSHLYFKSQNMFINNVNSEIKHKGRCGFLKVTFGEDNLLQRELFLKISFLLLK
jgi:hypothetical protein